MKDKKRILVVAAHPDDEILGCGGTIAKLIREGHEAHALILGEGVTSRDDKRMPQERKAELAQLKKHVAKAGEIIGFRTVTVKDLPDNRFDSVALLDVVKMVDKVKHELKPSIIFTHYVNDLNIDHGVTYRAVITAARPIAGETVKEIYAFETVSSTEWMYPLAFSPDVFVDVSETIQLKLKALKEYKVEMKDSTHPRSIEGVELVAKVWGKRTGLKYAEAFKAVRIIR